MENKCKVIAFSRVLSIDNQQDNEQKGFKDIKTGENMYSETYQVTVADLGYYEIEKPINIIVNDYGDHFEMKAVVDGVKFEAQADDMFSAFQLLRDKMLEMAWGIMCNAARINAIQSGMMRDMDVVYLVELGKQARQEDVHGFWDYCEMEEYVFTEEQEAFRKKWMESLKVQ